jgi:hypothetical protein
VLSILTAACASNITTPTASRPWSEEEVTFAFDPNELADPIYREVNEAEAQALDDGPWDRFLALVYEPGDITPAEGLQRA